MLCQLQICCGSGQAQPLGGGEAGWRRERKSHRFRCVCYIHRATIHIMDIAPYIYMYINRIIKLHMNCIIVQNYLVMREHVATNPLILKHSELVQKSVAWSIAHNGIHPPLQTPWQRNILKSHQYKKHTLAGDSRSTCRKGILCQPYVKVNLEIYLVAPSDTSLDV